MIINILNLIDSSVFFAKKELTNDTTFMCVVNLSPILEENRCGYRFTIYTKTSYGESSSFLEDVTSDPACAKELFDIICKNEVSPEHLKDVSEDFLAAR